MSALLYTAKPCGCLVIVMVNDEANLRYMADDLAAEAREGRWVKEATGDTLPPLRCPEHKRAEAERASMMELGL